MNDLDKIYMDEYAASFFPPEVLTEELPEVFPMRAGAMDAEMKAIPQTPMQEIMEKTGYTLEQVGEALDKIGKVNIGGFEIGLRDLMPFVGDAKDVTDPVTGQVTREQSGTPKALQMMGQGVSATTGTGMARQMRPDMGLGALDVAGSVASPIVRTARRAMKAATKGAESLAPKAGEMTEYYLTKKGMLLQFGPKDKQIEIPAAPKLETPAFKNWFGDSKVIDESGKPLVVYHGTMKDFDLFGEQIDVDSYKKMGLSQDGIFFFAKSPKIAETYTNYVEQGANIKPVYISLKNPLIIDAQGQKYNAGQTSQIGGNSGLTGDAISRAFDGGYDGVIIRNVRDDVSGGGDPTDVFVSFNREQIKSVFNKGTWNPKDPRISYGVGAGGAGAATQQEQNNGD